MRNIDRVLVTVCLLVLLVLIGCPKDTSDHLELKDGTLTGRYHTHDNDTLPDVSSSLCSYCYTIVSKYPGAEDVLINYYHEGKEIGFIIVDSSEAELARSTESLNSYKAKRLIDYKVAVYEGHTPLALTLNTAQLRPIITHSRGGNRAEGIMGTPLIQSDEQIVTKANNLIELMDPEGDGIDIRVRLPPGDEELTNEEKDELIKKFGYCPFCGEPPALCTCERP